MDSIHLVIFDCDGVLVDSEPIAIAVLLEIIREAGVVLGEEEAYRRFLGRSMVSISKDIEAEFGLIVTDDHLTAIRLRLYEEFRRDLRPIPGIAETLSKLDRPYCVASSSQPERIRLSLDVTGLLDRFEPWIYSSTMVRKGKPAPDLFLHAARSMGVQPASCLVVEDSVAGIQAAQRAGMHVFAFTGGSHAVAGDLVRKAAELKPDRVFDDMRALPGLIEGMAKAGNMA
ncbi:HAD superfamily hydrolase (TIGR01509 family)/HAD superfamily hydrolase (TIGR01549 family) [Mesorhizobium sp. J18]|nr:HAD superfamily hydrolase (TIGR01509 family)/HAD superfamily hydrolase (TIGR01549 family) [Mesorhizobium sp. J18]